MKSQLTEQSIQLFEKKGFSQTSIQDITNALQVTKGTFYYYFSSKEQLLMDIHDEYITNLIRRHLDIVTNPSISQRQKVIETMYLLIKDIPTKGPSARVFFREIRHLTSENQEIIKKKREEFRLNIEDIVQEGIEKKEFKTDLRADMIAFGILGVINWTYNWYNPDGELKIEELSEIYANLILDGITIEPHE